MPYVHQRKDHSELWVRDLALPPPQVTSSGGAKSVFGWTPSLNLGICLTHWWGVPTAIVKSGLQRAKVYMSQSCPTATFFLLLSLCPLTSFSLLPDASLLAPTQALRHCQSFKMPQEAKEVTDPLLTKVSIRAEINETI